jgi:hypothetical protein
MPKYSSGVSKAVVDVVLNYFNHETKTVNFVEAHSNDSNYHKMWGLINDILYHIRSKVVYRMESDESLITIKAKRFCNVLIVDSFEAFLKIYVKLTPEIFNYRGYFLVALIRTGKDQYSHVKWILEAMWKIYISRVNVLVQPFHNDKEALMYTFHPFSMHYCEEVHPVVLNRFINSNFTINVPYFPRKTKNLHKCPIKVATFNFPPYMMYEKLGHGEYHTTGIEGILLGYLSREMNFTLFIEEDDEKWGVLYPNGTATGATQKVIKNEANFTIGFFGVTPLRFQFMAVSYSYHTSSFTWQVPPGKPYSSLDKLFKPFKYIIWSCISTIFIVIFIVVVAIKFQPKMVRNFVYGERIESPFFNVLNIFFGGALTLLPRRNFARFILGLFLWYCLVIRSSYQGALFKFLQMDARENIVSGMREMIEKDFKLYMNEAAFNALEFPPSLAAR